MSLFYCLLRRHQASDDKSSADLKLGSKEVTLLDKSKVTIDVKFIQEKFNRAKDLLGEYKKYDPENRRIASIETLISQVNEKLNPSASAVHATAPKL